MAKQPKTIGLKFPIAGLNRRIGYQSQPPYSSPACSNVRPSDTYEGRERGGSRPGTVKAFAQELGSGNPVQCLEPVRVVGATGMTSDVLVAIANGVLYWNSAGTLTAVSGTLNTSANTLQATALHQKLYVADYRPTRVYFEDGVIASTNRLSSASVADWTALGIDTDLDVVVLTETAGSGTAEDDVYDITAVAAGYITIDATLTNGAGMTFELGRKVKIYDPATNAMTSIVATFGIPPVNCQLMCTYRDRLVLALGNTWFMSRQSDATDWDYTYDPADPARPVAGANSDAGFVGEPINALIPHSDDYLIFGCENSLWVLRGDPAWGGQIDALSREIGIVSANAWAKMPDATLMFLTRDGLYALAPGGDAYPQPISREQLPRELLDVDVENNVVSMHYDARSRGIHIFVTPDDGSTGDHWYADLTTGGFFPVALPDAQQAYCMASYAADPGEDQHVMLGGYDGYVRRFSDTATDDDGTPISSYVTLGPLQLGPPGHWGLLSELGGVMDGSSGTVVVEVMGEDTGEAAISGSAKYTTSMTTGRAAAKLPRVGAPSAAIKISSTVRWAMESLYAVVAMGGRIR